MLRFGYPSANLTIGCTTNRPLASADLTDVGRVRAAVGANLGDLRTIVRWNAVHNISLFRLNTRIVPYATSPHFPYDWQAEHAADWSAGRDVTRETGARLSFHAAQAVQPAHSDRDVSATGMEELIYLARVLHLLGADDGVIVLHLAGDPADASGVARRLADALDSDPDGEVCRYLALEADERVWTVQAVMRVAGHVGLPVIVDTLHHAANPGGISLEDALDRALPTWTTRPEVHLSSQDRQKVPGAHARLIDPDDLATLRRALADRDADIMVEAKGKEQAVLPLLWAESSGDR